METKMQKSKSGWGGPRPNSGRPKKKTGARPIGGAAGWLDELGGMAKPKPANSSDFIALMLRLLTELDAVTAQAGELPSLLKSDDPADLRRAVLLVATLPARSEIARTLVDTVYRWQKSSGKAFPWRPGQAEPTIDDLIRTTTDYWRTPERVAGVTGKRNVR